MATIKQLIRKPRKINNRSKNKKEGQLNCPQKRGICLRVYIASPKKPNSANRKVARVKLRDNKEIIAYIPGEGHNLQEHSNVLVRGGRVKDLIGVRFKILRGVYDTDPIFKRKQARSKFGVKKTIN